MLILLKAEAISSVPETGSCIRSPVCSSDAEKPETHKDGF